MAAHDRIRLTGSLTERAPQGALFSFRPPEDRRLDRLRPAVLDAGEAPLPPAGQQLEGGGVGGTVGVVEQQVPARSHLASGAARTASTRSAAGIRGSRPRRGRRPRPRAPRPPARSARPEGRAARRWRCRRPRAAPGPARASARCPRRRARSRPLREPDGRAAGAQLEHAPVAPHPPSRASRPRRARSRAARGRCPRRARSRAAGRRSQAESGIGPRAVWWIEARMPSSSRPRERRDRSRRLALELALEARLPASRVLHHERDQSRGEATGRHRRSARRRRASAGS